MLKYFIQEHGSKETKEITYEKALDLSLTCYRDNDMTRDMLKTVNRIQLTYSDILIEDHEENGSIMVLMAGLYNMLPMSVSYDDKGNHIS